MRKKTSRSVDLKYTLFSLTQTILGNFQGENEERERELQNPTLRIKKMLLISANLCIFVYIICFIEPFCERK